MVHWRTVLLAGVVILSGCSQGRINGDDQQPVPIIFEVNYGSPWSDARGFSCDFELTGIFDYTGRPGRHINDTFVYCAGTAPGEIIIEHRLSQNGALRHRPQPRVARNSIENSFHDSYTCGTCNGTWTVEINIIVYPRDGYRTTWSGDLGQCITASYRAEYEDGQSCLYTITYDPVTNDALLIQQPQTGDQGVPTA